MFGSIMNLPESVMSYFTDEKPIQYVNINGYSFLLPLNDGALLYWFIDQSDHRDYWVIAQLTEEEANTLYYSDHLGMMESIREELTYTQAMVVVIDYHHNSYEMLSFTIPRLCSEREFIDQFDSISEKIDRILDIEIDD